MKESKLLTVLRALTPAEMDGFTRYLNAFYEGQQVALRVWAYLHEVYPFKEEALLNPQKAFESMFPEEPDFKYRKLMDALSDLYLWLEEYLTWQAVKQNKMEADRHLALAFRAKGLKSLFGKKMIQWRKNLMEQPVKDIWDYNRLMEVNYWLYYHLTADNLDAHKAYVEDLMNNLDAFFVAAKLKFGCELINRNILYREAHTIHLLEDALSLVHSGFATKNAVHTGYAQVVRLLQNPNPGEEQYQGLKSFLQRNIQLLAQEDKVQILKTLISYNAKRIRSGNDFNGETFYLYKYGWENNILDFNGYLAPVQLLNIVDLACQLKEYIWLEHFKRNASDAIEPLHRASAIHLMNAMMTFEQGEFEKTQKLLQLVKYENNYYSIRARILLLRTFYEIDKKSEPINDYIKAFKQQLRRNKTIDKNLLNSCLAFCDILFNILNQKVSKTLLKVMLESKTLIAYKSWLLAKIEEK